MFSKRFIAAVAAATMAVTMASSAFAATNDPNMTTYNTPYSSIVNLPITEAQTVTLKAVPALADFTPTGFSQFSDAMAVTWLPVAGSNEDVVVSDEIEFEPITSGTYAGQFVAVKDVTIATDADPGPATITAKNPATNATMDFTVVVNKSDEVAKTGITMEFYNGSVTEANKLGETVSAPSVAWNTDTTSETILYPSVLDAAQAVENNNSSVDVTIADLYGNGTYMVTQVTAGGVTKANNDTTYEGWQYRVYRNNQVVELSDGMGAGEFALQSGDKIVFAYGSYMVDLFA